MPALTAFPCQDNKSKNEPITTNMVSTMEERVKEGPCNG